MNILFLCTANLNRSRTAEVFFGEKYPDHKFRSAGLSQKYCEKNKTTLCTIDMLEWADKIFVMEEMHIERIIDNSGITYSDKIINLSIRDEFKYFDDELLSLLKKKVAI